MSFVVVSAAALEAAANEMFHLSDSMVKVSDEADRLMKAVAPPATYAVSRNTTEGFAKHLLDQCYTVKIYALGLFGYGMLMRFVASKYRSAEDENAVCIG